MLKISYRYSRLFRFKLGDEKGGQVKLQEGPAFGALIIGVGVAYLMYKKTNNVVQAIGLGVVIAIADYVLVLVIKRVTNK